MVDDWIIVHFPIKLPLQLHRSKSGYCTLLHEHHFCRRFIALCPISTLTLLQKTRNACPWMLLSLWRLLLLENRNVLTEERSAWYIQKTKEKLADLLNVTQSKRSAMFFSPDGSIEDHSWNVLCWHELLAVLYFCKILLRSLVARNRTTRREHDSAARGGGGMEREK